MVLKAGIVATASLATTAVAYNQATRGAAGGGGGCGGSSSSKKGPWSNPQQQPSMSWSHQHRDTIQQQHMWKN